MKIYLLSSVGVGRYVHKLVDSGSEYALVLRCNQHASHPHQLEFSPIHWTGGRESVEVVDREEEGFG
jgi:hypothetical protein